MLPVEALKSIPGLGKAESGQISTAYTVAMGLLGESVATADDFVEAARGKLFDPEDEGSARAIAGAICDLRGDIKVVLASAELAGSVLPSFMSLDTSLDVRMKFADGKLLTAAPVVVAYLDTDANGEEIWFQMTKGDIEGLVKQFNVILSDIKAAEALIPKT
jgi:hypothetical protein